MKRFENKITVITGAASGIGAATARRIASEGGRIMVAKSRTIGCQTTAGRRLGTGRIFFGR